MANECLGWEQDNLLFDTDDDDWGQRGWPLDEWKGISAGYRNILAIKKDGTLWTCGDIDAWQITGDGYPVMIDESTDWSFVGSSYDNEWGEIVLYGMKTLSSSSEQEVLTDTDIEFKTDNNTDIVRLDTSDPSTTNIGSFVYAKHLGDASVPEPLSSKFPIQIAYDYYLPRRDILEINDKGGFRLEQGISGDTPATPMTNEDYTLLAKLELRPYNANVKNSISIKEDPIRRYTMRDIGHLEKRLENTELTISSIAVNDVTASIKTLDENGLNRFKCGFLTDTFTDHAKSNVADPSFKVAIDYMKQECRPTYYADNIKLIEADKNLRKNNFYTVSGDLVTLPYIEVEFLGNMYGSTPQNITPLTNIRRKNGTLNIWPTSDSWMSTEQTADINQISDGNYTSMKQIVDKLDVTGTVYGAWTEVDKNIEVTGNTTRTETVGWTTNTINTQTGVITTDFIREGEETYAEEIETEIGRVNLMQTSAWDEHIRSRSIVLYAQGFLPQHNMFVIVDNYDLSEFVEPARSIAYTSKTGTFLNYLNSSIDHSNLEYRQYGDNSYNILERGEIVIGQTSNASAILLNDEYGNLKVVNVKGDFSVGEIVLGMTSGASVVISGLSDDSLQTSQSGTFYGILNLPSDSKHKIYSGIMPIVIRDSLIAEQATTSGSATYDAHGISNTANTTIMSVKNLDVGKRKIIETNTTVENFSTSTVVSSVIDWAAFIAANIQAGDGGGGGGGDPLAQSFQIQSDAGGVFITHIDLFVYSVNQTEPVFLEIREMFNGFPSTTVVPMSTVYKNVEDLTPSTTELIPTSFVFESPIFLKSGTEYCFVIGSPYMGDQGVEVWASVLGDVDIYGNTTIDQPSFGSMFISQNGSTWDAEQYKDVCFMIHKAQFDTTNVGQVMFVNNKFDYDKMDIDPIRVKTGISEARVLHKNHGFVVGDAVTINDPNDELVGSTSFSAITKTFNITNTTLDSFMIPINAASMDVWTGKSSISLSTNKKFDELYLDGRDFVLPNTQVEYRFKKTTLARKLDTMYYPINLKQTYALDDSGWILSEENEDLFLDGEKSFYTKALLYSSHPDVSPVIDLSTYSVNCITNRIDNMLPEYSNRQVDDVLIHDGTNTYDFEVVDDGLYIITCDGINDKFKVGGVIYFTGGDAPCLNTNIDMIIINKTATTILVKPVNDVEILQEEVILDADMDIHQYDFYVDSVSPTSQSNAASYVPLTFTTTIPAKGFIMLFDYNVPTSTSIRLFYKTSHTSKIEDINKKSWVEFPEENVTPYINSSNPTHYIEKRIDIDTIDDTFDTLSVKVEFRSDITTKIPKIKNFRILTVV